MFNQFYFCKECSALIEAHKNTAQELSCCGFMMEKMNPNTFDASLEKHVPVIKVLDNEVLIEIGSEPHPMIEAHYIEWIEILCGAKKERKYLLPGELPKTIFLINPQKGDSIKALAYCNLHGLWLSEIVNK